MSCGRVTPLVGREQVENHEPTSWLLEEYKLLSAHYFHEDTYFQHSVTTFSTLNSGLIAFYSSDLLFKTSSSRLVLPIIGIVLCAVWAVSLLRTRERRRYAEIRIVEIEASLHGHWQEGDLSIRPLDIGTRRGWDDIGRSGMWGKLRMGWIRDIPASKLALVLPPGFIAIWVLLLIF